MNKFVEIILLMGLITTKSECKTHHPGALVKSKREVSKRLHNDHVINYSIIVKSHHVSVSTMEAIAYAGALTEKVFYTNYGKYQSINSKSHVTNSKFQIPGNKFRAPNSNIQITNSRFQTPISTIAIPGSNIQITNSFF